MYIFKNISYKINLQKLKLKEYQSLKLRSKNRNITLEFDFLGRYYKSIEEGSTNILFLEYDYNRQVTNQILHLWHLKMKLKYQQAP